MGTFFRTLFKIIAGLLALLIVTVLILIFVGVKLDLSFLRGGVEASAGLALGRDVTITGPVELEFSNWPALDVSDVNRSGARVVIFQKEASQNNSEPGPLTKT